MTVIPSLSMSEMDVRVVVPNEFPMGLLHLIPGKCSIEIIIRESPHYPDYVELLLPLVVPSPHYASYLAIFSLFQIPNNL